MPRVLVTGAGSGIGRATALRFAGADYRVVAADRDAAGLDTTAAEATGSAPVEAVALDLRDTARVEEVVAALGPLDAVVNAAGVLLRKPLAETTVADLEDVMAVNLTGAYAVCRAAAPGLAERGGAIVNVASIAARIGLPALSAYSASKGAIVALSRALAYELAPRVRVNVVCPGAVDTPMAQQIPTPETPPDRGRLLAPAEIAAVIWHLATPESGATTGHCYVADGGRTA